MTRQLKRSVHLGVDLSILELTYPSWSWFIHLGVDLSILELTYPSWSWFIHLGVDLSILELTYPSWSWFIHLGVDLSILELTYHPNREVVTKKPVVVTPRILWCSPTRRIHGILLKNTGGWKCINSCSIHLDQCKNPMEMGRSCSNTKHQSGTISTSRPKGPASLFMMFRSIKCITISSWIRNRISVLLYLSRISSVECQILSLCTLMTLFINQQTRGNANQPFKSVGFRSSYVIISSSVLCKKNTCKFESSQLPPVESWMIPY